MKHRPSATQREAALLRPAQQHPANAPTQPLPPPDAARVVPPRSLHRRGRGGASILWWIALAGLVAGLLAGGIEALAHHPLLARVPASSATPATMSPTQATMITPSPVLLAQDTFERADQLLWGTASDGERWRGDANRLPAFFIQGSAGHITAATGRFNALLGPVMADSSVLVQGSMRHFRADGTSNLGVVARWTDSTHWYKALLDGSHLSLLKSVGSTPITLASIPFRAQDQVFYALELRVTGPILSAIAWAPQQMSEPPVAWLLRATDADLVRGQDGVRVLLHQTTCTMTYFRAD